MALSPETLDALEQALTAVIDEAGDDPQFADLAAALQDAQHALSGLEGADHEAAEPRDGDEDAHSFDVAEKRMTERRKAAPGDKGAA